MSQAVILAGGKGTRLRARLHGRPKPLVDVDGVPLLERQLQLLARYGVDDVLLLVNHAADQIIEFCAAREAALPRVRCIDEGAPRGTAGATLAAWNELADEFLVMYGDTMLDVDLARFEAFHRAAGDADATLFLHPNDHPQDSDLVELDDQGRVRAFHGYPHDPDRYYPNLVNAALYWLRRDALAPWRDEPGLLDFGKDIFPRMLTAGCDLRGYVSPEYIKDVGTPERLDRVCAHLREGRIERSSLAHRQPMVFLDRDGTINREVDHLRDPDDFELLPGAAEAIRRLNASEYRCCVVTNQPVVARGDVSMEGLRDIHAKMETLLGRSGAYLDRIYLCPHHPHRGFAGERPELKVECECRKPGTGMLEQAGTDFNVESGASWMIGDSSVDMETARRAGVRSVLVETGHGGLDRRWWTRPDYVAPDLAGAVAFILDDHPRLLERCRQFVEQITPAGLVLVGGQSRSGKSTFASALRDALRASGRRAQVLCIDRWLKDEADRGPGVAGRYDLPALEALMQRLGDPGRRCERISLPAYDRLERRCIEDAEALALHPDDVLIVEGTIALALAAAAGAGAATGASRFFVRTDESTRFARLQREYRLRGFEPDHIDALYRARMEDEVPFIEATAGDAHIINLDESAT